MAGTTSLQKIQEVLDRIEMEANELLYRVKIGGSQIIVQGLDEISGNLGLVVAGEFRAGIGMPGRGFTGVRIGSPGWTYGRDRYSIVGINNDVLQFGLSNTDGKMYAGGGAVVLSDNGLVIQSNGSLDDYNSIQYKYRATPETLTTINMSRIIAEYRTSEATTFNALWIETYKAETDPWDKTAIYLVSTDYLNDQVARINIDSDSGITMSANESQIQALMDGSVVLRPGGTNEISLNGRSNFIDQTTSGLAAERLLAQFQSSTMDYATGTYTELNYVRFDAPTIQAAAASTVTRSSTVHIHGSPALYNFTATRSYGLDVEGGVWVQDGGLNLHNGISAGDGSMSYSGDLLAYRNSTNYTGYIFVPLDTPLTSTSWDGDSYSSVGTSTQIDLSAVFGAPAGIKAVAIKVEINDSASFPTAGLYFGIGPSATNWNHCVPQALGADVRTSLTGIVPCDANGDIWYRISASGASTMDVRLMIVGYFI